jgi:LemA protein
MAALVIVLIVLVILVVIAVAFLIVQFNKLRRLDLLAQGAFAGIDTLLTKRADLIPNLVATVKGAADFEQGTLENVTKARAASVSAGSIPEKLEADNMLTQALTRFFAVAEAYPQLTATANFKDLQKQLASVEGELQYARQYYNDAVGTLNTALRTIPSMWFAGIAKVSVREFYKEADETRRAAPKVEF